MPSHRPLLCPVCEGPMTSRGRCPSCTRILGFEVDYIFAFNYAAMLALPYIEALVGSPLIRHPSWPVRTPEWAYARPYGPA